MTPTHSLAPGLLRLAPGLLLAVFAALLLTTARRGIDTPDWREADIASIARNFSRESMNPLAPRIDWRGDGPGIIEMEPPILPFAMALLSPWFGEDVRVGRLLSLAASLGTFALFLSLARERLSPLGCALAGVFYALNPLIIQTATELRPEPLMLLGSVASVRFTERWLRLGARRDRAAALATTAFAIFAKLTALYLGLLYAALALRRRGPRALRDRELWGFALLALLPAALWHAHAHGLWLRYGNSLGISNQDHFFGFDLLAQPRPLLSVLERQVDSVFTSAGMLLVCAAACLGRWRHWLELELWWALAIAVLFVATAPTAGASWAAYYHVIAVPVAALLVGDAGDALWTSRWTHPLRRALAQGAGVALLFAALFQAGSASAPIVARRIPGGAVPEPLRVCAERFARQIVPPDTRVLVSAEGCRERIGGRRNPHNRPYLFYWMDRKGFQLCREQHSLDAIADVAARGAAFFAAERHDLRHPPDFEMELRAIYPVVAECQAALLFDLRSAPRERHGASARVGGDEAG